MKIALLSPLYPYRGGLAQFGDELMRELGKENEIKGFSYTTLYPNFLFPGTTQFVENDDESLYQSERILSSVNPLSYIQTAKKINQFNPEILIIPYWISFLAPALGSVIRFIKKEIKIVALIHNVIPHEKRFFDKTFASYFLKKCDAFIVLSQSVKLDLLKIIPKANVFLKEHPIYNKYISTISKTAACTKLNIDSDKKNLLFFGLIRDYKGLDLLINAMSHLDHSYQLIIAGECYGSFDKYQTLINESLLRNNIYIFEQYISDNEVPTFFAAADLLVLPYRSATQSGVIATGYQLEKPMVVTNVGALSSFVSKANTGIVADSVSAEGIANAVKKYFEDNHKEKYIENIHIEKERLSFPIFARDLITFIKKLK